MAGEARARQRHGNVSRIERIILVSGMDTLRFPEAGRLG
jgi:hypothetical protein